MNNESSTLSLNSNLPNALTYTGRQWDDDAKLYHYRARVYDPELGIFLQQDPIFSANPYSYVGNDPINAIDPLGMSEDYCSDRVAQYQHILVGYGRVDHNHVRMFLVMNGLLGVINARPITIPTLMRDYSWELILGLPVMVGATSAYVKRTRETAMIFANIQKTPLALKNAVQDHLSSATPTALIMANPQSRSIQIPTPEIHNRFQHRIKMSHKLKIHLHNSHN